MKPNKPTDAADPSTGSTGSPQAGSGQAPSTGSTGSPQASSGQDLRHRAEARLSKKQRSSRSEDSDQRTEADLGRLQHELEVHQIELEMQNEELQQAQAKTEAALEKYTDLYDFAPMGYFTLAADGTILAVNLTGSHFLRIERARLLNRRFALLISETDRPAFNAFLQNVFASHAKETCEVALHTEGKEPLWVHIEATCSEDRQECRAAVLDVTERKLAEVARKWLEEEGKQLFKELQTALEDVKTLSGLLPICSSCKRIRDDDGYWIQIEEYVQEHSPATFSHGTCPECIMKSFPQDTEEQKNEGV
jgi:PAS domain-containing protein